MELCEMICILIADLVPFFSALISFIYGIKHFFKKGKALYLQSITMAMGCYSLGCLYHICQTLVSFTIVEGFTPAYLGHIGFFLFFITASYGQMDRIVDDGSRAMLPSRYIAAIAPLGAILLYIPNALIDDVSFSTKITYLCVWIPAAVSMYFNLKHAIIPDMDFGFIKAIKPYNILAVCLGFSELVYLTAWNFFYPFPMAISALIFGALFPISIMEAKKGAEKWII